METLVLTALALPFLAAPLLAALGPRLGQRVGWVALPVPLFAALVLAWVATGLDSAAPPEVRLAWIPAFGIDLVFHLDGLALFYGLVVSGIGTLIVFYACFYLDGHYRDHGKFYAYLMLFMAAMLMTVMSGNLMLLFVSWEITGLTSFLLIGFLHETKKSAYGARMALLTTAFTGLLLMIGVILVGQAYGTYELAVILAAGPPPGSETLANWAFVFCVLGIFGKSAQFPFFFWLPNAMAAPTPVSAYLHSATMVKLGVFLTARLLPVFHHLDAWTPVLTLFGFGTMLLGAILAVLSWDLKAILAYSTVSQLGLLIGYYGLFPAGAPVTWDYVHILNHVFYKACLFMVVGIVDHSCGTRDVREIGGLARLMPLTAIAALIGVASMGGVPLTTGFLSKEMLLKTTREFWLERELLADWVFFAVITASLVKIVFSIKIFHQTFMGPVTSAVKKHYHAPSLGMQLPPLFLAACTVVFGIASVAFGRLTDVFSVSGKHVDQLDKLKLWHGLTPELAISAGIVLAGFIVYIVIDRTSWAWVRIPRVLQFDAFFERFVEAIPRFGNWTIRFTQADRPMHYLPVILGVALVLWAVVARQGGAELAAAVADAQWLPEEPYGWHRYFVVLMLAGGLVALVVARDWVLQLLALSVIGFLVSFYFVLYKAPDLALTQILVETASLLLVLMFVMRVRRAGKGPAPRPLSGYRAVRLAVSVGVGVAFAGLLFVVQPTPGGPADTPVGEALLAASVPEAKGSNVVNTTLVDFRGLDTLFEALVLLIATLGCLGLLMRRRADRPPQPVAVRGGSTARDVTPVGDSFILGTVVTFLFFLINVFALYLFLRGHNLPGGGFIAGLCTGLSFVMLGFVQGIEKLHRFLRLDPARLAVLGMILAIASGLVAPLAGGEFFRHYHPYFRDVPLLGDVYLGTPLFFDLGIYLVVVGIVLKIVFPLVKSVEGFRAFLLEEERAYAAHDEEPVEPEALMVQPEEGRPQ
jgi:NADH:ubiquinone oxidoreductase subunit 5 (subunit L)/multisubunit Na+/H+ antiporter MnhA subunit/multisubunit Na+/H+ antiporter MnhB subunit